MSSPLRRGLTRLDRIDRALGTRRGRGRAWLAERLPAGTKEGSPEWYAAAEAVLDIAPWPGPDTAAPADRQGEVA